MPVEELEVVYARCLVTHDVPVRTVWVIRVFFVMSMYGIKFETSLVLTIAQLTGLIRQNNTFCHLPEQGVSLVGLIGTSLIVLVCLSKQEKYSYTEIPVN